jgi:PAS domain S-box-containing protein
MREKSPQRSVSWPPVGEFRYVARQDRWEWSDEVAQMHGYEPGTVTPTTELVLRHQHPHDRATLAELIERVRRNGAPFSSRQRIVDTRGGEHLVLVIGDGIFDEGEPAGASGYYVDITQQLNEAVQERLNKAVLAVSARRAVIDQAIGMLMLRYKLTSDVAFQLLTRLSQESNIKLRIIAERVVDNADARGTILDKMAEHVAAILESTPERQPATRQRPDNHR